MPDTPQAQATPPRTETGRSLSDSLVAAAVEAAYILDAVRA